MPASALLWNLAVLSMLVSGRRGWSVTSALPSLHGAANVRLVAWFDR